MLEEMSSKTAVVTRIPKNYERSLWLAYSFSIYTDVGPGTCYSWGHNNALEISEVLLTSLVYQLSNLQKVEGFAVYQIPCLL